MALGTNTINRQLDRQYPNYQAHSVDPRCERAHRSKNRVFLQLWVYVACYQHETPKKKTNQEASVVLTVCIGDKTSSVKHQEVHGHADKRTESIEWFTALG